MSWLSDRAVERLRVAAREPDFSGTPYRALRQIGRGGMGTVYLAEDTRLERRVAVKVLDAPESSGELAARLLREARILARLEHPGIVPVHDVGTLADGRVYYAMKYVEGRRLDQHAPTVTGLRERLGIFQRICDAVAFAHARGVIHRDLKPQNVMVGPFGEVLVMDWGVAKLLPQPAGGRAAASAVLPSTGAPSAADPPAPPSADTAHGAVLGTPGYMAPEQARGEIQRLDCRADIFSLGALLRFLLTSPAAPDAATTADSARRARAGAAAPPHSPLPRALAAICTKAMAQEPEQRYPHAEEMAADVARYLDGDPVSAYAEGMLGKAARLYKRYQVAILLVLAYLVMRVILILLARR